MWIASMPPPYHAKKWVLAAGYRTIPGSNAKTRVRKENMKARIMEKIVRKKNRAPLHLTIIDPKDLPSPKE